MPFDPKAYIEKHSGEGAGFDPKAYLQKYETPDPEHGLAVTAVDKLANGMSGGLADEASGGVEALGRIAGLKGLGGTLNDLEMSPEGPTTDWEVLKQAYLEGRNKDRKKLKEEQKQHPGLSNTMDLGGMIFSPLNKVGLGTAGAIQGFGNSESEDIPGIAADTALGYGVGKAAGLAGDHIVSPLLQKATPYLEKAEGMAQGGFNKIGEFLKDKAGSLAENATGATRTQAEKFAPGAGRELLDRGLIKFGDTSKNIAARTEAAMNGANSDIDSSLKALDAKGVTASADNVVAQLEQKIAELKKDPSQADVVRKLQGIIQDITETGESNIPISQAEQTKRGFNKMSKNWQDPNIGQAGKAAYQGYRGEVENVATAADQALADKFKSGKETYGLLAPIQEAAEKRALQQNQAPFGGLGDWSSAAAGGAIGGPIGSVGAVAAKKLIAPRVTSSAAVGLDKIGDLVKSAPQALGKFANVLQSAEARGPQGLAATHFILQQTNPEYRQVLMRAAGDPNEGQ